MTAQLLEAALAYRRLEFSVIPCGPDKRPLIKWAEFQQRRPSEEEIAAWWTKWPEANVGIVTGAISGLTVIDCDTAEAVATVEALLPDTLACPVVVTPRGGRHFWFKYTPELKTRNGAAPGIDIKNDGAFVVAPPSTSANGTYQCQN
jgi:hypothetical protein